MHNASVYGNLGHMKKKYMVSIMLVLAVVAGCVVIWLHDTRLANVSIDWLAFLAGGFLVTEGAYGIIRSHTPFFPDQFLKTIRIIIGVNIFTIHLIQLIRY